MRIRPVIVACVALTLGACASPTDVRSTASFSDEAGEVLPPVDQSATIPLTSNAPATLPGTRPVDVSSQVLLASDLPGWDVGSPMNVPAEPTWEALDCPDMNVAWGVTGHAGTRSRGTNGGASFRNTAVELATAEAAGDVLDAVDRVWTECTLFETDLASFWSEPIVMPKSTFRTSGIVIGGDSSPNWTLAFWQVGTTVVVLEVEGSEMWTYLDPLLATLSARLDGTPTTIDVVSGTTIATATPDDEQAGNLPVIEPVTPPPIESPTATTITVTTTDPQPDTFPPSEEDWADHPLAHLAPAPGEIGPGWEYEYGRRQQAAPANPDDAIEGCDVAAPPTLDGYEASYSNTRLQAEIMVTVGDGTPAESQTWIDAFRAITGCDLDESGFIGSFDLVDAEIEGADDSVIVAGDVDPDDHPKSVQVIGAARVDGTLVVAFAEITFVDARTIDAASTHVGDVLALMLP